MRRATAQMATQRAVHSCCRTSDACRSSAKGSPGAAARRHAPQGHAAGQSPLSRTRASSASSVALCCCATCVTASMTWGRERGK